MLEKSNDYYDIFKKVKTAFNAKLKSLEGCSVCFNRHNGKEFQWIQDKYSIIGNDYVHYELYCDKSSIYIDLHLEDDEQPEEITKLVKDLYVYLLDKEYSTDFISWFNWAKKVNSKDYFQSIRFHRAFSLDEEDILSEESINEMIQSFVDLDNIIGDDIREFLIKNKQVKEEIAIKYVAEKNMKHPLNQILYGPPGTGKTYHTINKALAIVAPDFDLSQERELVKEEFDKYLENGQIVFTTFHQSMTYEDFVEGIKPKEIEGKVTYEIKNGFLKLLCNTIIQNSFSVGDLIGDYEINKIGYEIIYLKKPRAESIVPIPKYLINELSQLVIEGKIDYESIKNKDAVNMMSPTTEKYIVNGYPNILAMLVEKNNRDYPICKKNKVLIIDEINRGNVSAIFGELITLIEESKRLGNEEALEVTLPYSKEKFGVPNNLYIIGTMNTADRSVEALDTALRRRFTFEEMMPDYEVIESDNSFGIDLKEVLEVINKRIEVLLDRDHLIGHSYFLNVDSVETLQSRFMNNIIPLLQEYFYGDYGKIGLVLGKGFVEKSEGNKVVFASFDYDSEMYQDKVIYSLKSIEDEGEFKVAIDNLLGKK
ncbi:AAA domain-containing protein [Myroides sp. BIT-d1]|uniref:AAA domain-containing protein n=2 Tax=Myroides albus TaxID=2562892 RepID=A0A6I3LQI2_9FLAO|nr:AAA domain-containing protein [Myroides albus]